MNIIDAIGVSLADLYFRRFRTALATLGIVFGVAAVQAMLCIGEGAKQEALDGIAQLGVDKIFVRSDLAEAETSEDNTDLDKAERPGLLLRDQHHLQEHFLGVEQVVAAQALRSTLFSMQGQETAVSVMAPNAAYRSLSGAQMLKGRFLAQVDEDETQTVCVVGRKAARSIFYYEDPIGKFVDILGQPFTVVGVLENKQNVNGLTGVIWMRWYLFPLQLPCI